MLQLAIQLNASARDLSVPTRMRSRLEHAVLVPFPVPVFLHCAVGVLFLVGVVFCRSSLFCIPSVLFPSLASANEWFPSEVFLKTFFCFRLDKKKKTEPSLGAETITTRAGFEPTRAEPNGFLVRLLNHSDTLPLNIPDDLA